MGLLFLIFYPSSFTGKSDSPFQNQTALSLAAQRPSNLCGVKALRLGLGYWQKNEGNATQDAVHSVQATS
jgi:hypothetical protein